MDVEALISLVRTEHARVLPFVGSGLTRAAGAPGVERLARELADRTGVDYDPDEPDLTIVARDAEDRHGTLVVQDHIAEIFSGLRLRPTPALTAVCGTSGRRVLTTNYDDGLERAARERGLEPITLLPNDARIVDDKPGLGQLYVVHLHGIPDEPSSIVLPGATTHGLADDQVFTRFVSAVMAPKVLLYLGLSLSFGETHLREIVRWLGAKPQGARRHYLLLDRAQARRRKDDLNQISTYRNVTVVLYEADPEHTAAERVAVALAPRDEDELTWVQPPLLRVPAGADHDRLRARISGFDYEWNTSRDDVETPANVLDQPRSLVVGGPGLGKTTLLENLPYFDPERAAARADLRDFRPSRPPERAIGRLFRDLPVEALTVGGALLMLDGVDEVDDEVETDVVEAISAAFEQWPDHTWVVTSRPGRAADALAASGIPVFLLFASRRWARVYLLTRAVPADRVRRALLDGYGLGDLMAIPVFAKRLADRLLEDDHSETTPLALLVDEQYDAARREALRHRHPTANLSDWLRSVAIALELRGRVSASTDELVEIRGPGDLRAMDARARLVEVSLLADVPGSTAFPARTLQEGLAADAILRSRDVVATVRAIAVAHVGGADHLRDDMEMTLDLVFEHADRTTRRHLQEIDALRWARTVITTGTEPDAREAFGLIMSWHAERELAFALGGESGLRTTRQAISEIARLWPQVIEEWRDLLEEDLHDAHAATRLRALMVLSGLPRDDRTIDWLLPMLGDTARRVTELAASTAGQLRITEAQDALESLLDSHEENVRAAALRALVEIVDAKHLPRLAAVVKSSGDLRRVATRLDERLDVDATISLVRNSREMNETTAWLIDRVIDSAHPAAWTPARVSGLMTACGSSSGIGEPDPERLASVFALHPSEAIAAIRLRGVGGEPYAPRQQLLPLSRLDPARLEADKHADLRRATERALEETAELQARREAPERASRRLPELLDAHGVDVDPNEIDLGIPPPRDLEERHRELLLQLVDRWWPSAGFPDEIDERTHATLVIGSSIDAPLPVARWRELLDAHMTAPPFGRDPLGRDSVTAWLRETYADSYSASLVDRIRHAEGDALVKLALIGRVGPPGPIKDAVVDRIRELGPRADRWSSVVIHLVEHGAAEAARALLTLDVPPDVRAPVLVRLARAGDAAAQVELLDDLASRVEAGERPDRLSFIDFVSSPDVLAALGRLADAGLTHGAGELRSSALGHLGRFEDTAVLNVLEDLGRRHGAHDPWIEITREKAARRFATTDVRNRLPRRLADVAAWFDTMLPHGP